jgi:multidrug efflux system membrane fusion protein
MDQTKSIDIPQPGTGRAVAAAPSKSRWWPWVLVLGVIVLGGWYYRSSRNASQAADAPAPGAASKGKGGSGAGGPIVPVVVASAQRGDLPVYFNGLGTVTAFNTVTVRSRVDGQLISIAFKEGQFVREGDLLAQIDPRPFQVQLAQAMGQLAKDQAQRRDAEVNLERFKLLFKEGVIPQQQLDTQAALAPAHIFAHYRADQRPHRSPPRRRWQHRACLGLNRTLGHHPASAHIGNFQPA